MFCKYPPFSTRVGFLTIALCLWAPVSHAELLADAVESALRYHPGVEAAIANRDAYAQERKEQWAEHFPSLNLRGSGGRVYGDNSTSRGLTVTRGAAYSPLWEGSATLTQPLFDGFETFNRVDAAQMRQNSATYNIVDVRENLALRTVIAYLDVLRSREALEKVNLHKKLLEDYRTRIQKMVNEGAADESMVVQAQDIAKQLESTMVDLEGQLKSSNAQYAELTGHMPDDPMERPVPRPDVIPDVADEAVAYAKQNHPALKAAQSTEQALAYDADAEKQFYYPDVNGEFSYLKRDQVDEIGGEVIDAKAVVRLNWDISLAGGQVARMRKAQQRQYEGRAKRAETERTIEREIRTAFSDLETAQARVNLQNDRVSINERLFKNYQAQFEGARVNLLQLLQSDNAVFNTKLGLMNSEYRLVASRFAVLASMGRLQEALTTLPARADDK